MSKWSKWSEWSKWKRTQGGEGKNPANTFESPTTSNVRGMPSKLLRLPKWTTIMKGEKGQNGGTKRGRRKAISHPSKARKIHPNCQRPESIRRAGRQPHVKKRDASANPGNARDNISSAACNFTYGLSRYHGRPRCAPSPCLCGL